MFIHAHTQYVCVCVCVISYIQKILSYIICYHILYNTNICFVPFKNVTGLNISGLKISVKNKCVKKSLLVSKHHCTTPHYLVFTFSILVVKHGKTHICLGHFFLKNRLCVWRFCGVNPSWQGDEAARGKSSFAQLIPQNPGPFHRNTVSYSEEEQQPAPQ